MKNSKKIVASLLTLSLPFWAVAQCAVCPAGAVSSGTTSGGIGNTINSGILYLLTITYLVLAAVAIYFLRDYVSYYYRMAVQRMRMFLASL